MSDMPVNSNYKNLCGFSTLKNNKSTKNDAVKENPKVKKLDCMSFGIGIDSEEKAIMDRLIAYGCTPTGDKATDKAKLHRIELERAKQDNYVSNKYLTVSSSECERIQERKKDKKKIVNPEKKQTVQDRRLGEKLRGEQIYLAIKMKNRTENSKSSSANKGAVTRKQ